MTKIRTALLAAMLGVLALASPGTANAAVLHDYKFSFTGSAIDGSPLVTGVVRGLMEGANSVNTVEVLSNSLGYGIGTYTHNDDGFLGAVNWTVTGGEITAWNFVSAGLFNSGGDVTDSALGFTSNAFGLGPASGLTNSPSLLNADLNTAIFEKVVPATPVPLPLPAALLGTALLGLGLIGARRRRPA